MTGSGSTNWLDDVTFWVNGIASRTHTRGGTSAGGGGGGAPSGAQGFSLTREEAERALQEFREIRNELMRMERDALELTRLRPPAGDPASVQLNEAIVGGSNDPGAFGYGYGHIKKEIAYFDELVHRLELALGYVTDADESTSRDIGDAGGSVRSEEKGFAE
jgi:hypothetical protein